MQATSPYDRLRHDVIGLFPAQVDDKAIGLQQVLRRSVEYVNIDRLRRELVIDRRAILLGMVANGLDPENSDSNSSKWFSNWLRPRLSHLDLPRACEEARTSEDALAKAMSEDFSLVPSGSIRTAMTRAVNYAKGTVGRDKVALRHLFVAIVSDPGHELEIKEFNWKPTDTDKADLTAKLFSHIAATPEPDENLEA